MKLIVLNLVLKIIKLQGKAAINGGWRWGWLFSGSCGPLLKQQPGQVGDKVDAPTELDIIVSFVTVGIDQLLLVTYPILCTN